MRPTATLTRMTRAQPCVKLTPPATYALTIWREGDETCGFLTETDKIRARDLATCLRQSGYTVDLETRHDAR